MLREVLIAASFVIVCQALRCHIVSSGNLSTPDHSTAQECVTGSLTCVKVVDFTRGTYTKQCQSINCTMNGVPNSVAHCQNTTIGFSGQTCCCYGDACNSAPQSAIFSVFGLGFISYFSTYFIN